MRSLPPSLPPSFPACLPASPSLSLSLPPSCLPAYLPTCLSAFLPSPFPPASLIELFVYITDFLSFYFYYLYTLPFLSSVFPYFIFLSIVCLHFNVPHFKSFVTRSASRNQQSSVFTYQNTKCERSQLLEYYRVGWLVSKKYL